MKEIALGLGVLVEPEDIHMFPLPDLGYTVALRACRGPGHMLVGGSDGRNIKLTSFPQKPLVEQIECQHLVSSPISIAPLALFLSFY